VNGRERGGKSPGLANIHSCTKNRRKSALIDTKANKRLTVTVQELYIYLSTLRDNNRSKHCLKDNLTH
jgi:hypothetical protein